MGKRIPEKDRKKRGQFGKKHKRESAQHEKMRAEINLLLSASTKVGKKNEHSGGSGSVTIVVYRFTVECTLFTITVRHFDHCGILCP